MPLTQVKLTLGSSRAGSCHCGLVLWRPKPVKPVMPMEGRPPATTALLVGRPGMLLKAVLPMERLYLPALVRSRPRRASSTLLEPKSWVKPSGDLLVEHADLAVGLAVSGNREWTAKLTPFSLRSLTRRKAERDGVICQSKRRSPLSALSVKGTWTA